MEESSLFPLSELQDENGLFQYKNIPFGSSPDEVMQQIPEDFEQMEAEDTPVEEYVVYYLKERFDFYGSDASLFFDFAENKLDTVKIQFKTDEEQFQEILVRLTELYGEPELRNGEGGIFESEIYAWKKDNTHLQAVLITKGTTVAGAIGLFKME